MGKQISLTLPDELMRRVEAFAGQSGRQVAEVLTDAIEVSIDLLVLGIRDARSSADPADRSASSDGTAPTG